MYSGRAFSHGFPCLSQSSASSTCGAKMRSKKNAAACLDEEGKPLGNQL